jgi:levanase
MDAIEPPAPAAAGTTVVFADFERGYGDWRVEQGDAFGTGPAAGTLADQQPVSGFEGQRLVNTFLGGDQATGLLVSPEFTIEHPYVAFRIGGGGDLQELALTLELVDGTARRRVRAATGRDAELLREAYWDVREFAGRRAVLTVRDSRTGPWGHVMP